ncbi:MAG: Pyridinium-3,5-bisthiocarboxylic acid mononucleotide nickel insertion protein [Desulfovibrio sp.]
MVENVAVLESHIDHLTGEELGHAFAMLQEAGAVDVIWLPGIMKKNRPGGVLRAVCMPESLESVQEAFFRHTHTLGIRRMIMERVVLPRRADEKNGLAAKTYEVEGVSYTREEFEALVKEAATKEVGLPALRFSRGE